MSVHARPGERLTPKEVDVLQLMSKGYSDEQIADLLHKSRHTIASRVRSILIRLQASNRTEAACRGIREGIIK